MRLPESSPEGCAFWASFSGDEFVEFPDGTIFKLDDSGESLSARTALPFSGCAPIAESNFLNCARTCRDYAAKGAEDEKQRARHDLPEALGNDADKARALFDFEAALQELREYLKAHPMSPQEFEGQLRWAAEEALARAALEPVPITTALNEMGFRLRARNSTEWRWVGEHAGSRLEVRAGQDTPDHWHIDGVLVKTGESVADGWMLAPSEPRGKIVHVVLSMWRAAFGTAARPPGVVDVGRLYEQHGGKRGRLNLGLPRMQLDGPMLRATRKRIRKRHGRCASAWLKLSMQDGVLRMEIDGAVYAMPAQGAIGVECEVSLADFIGIPPARLRGRTVTLERGAAGLAIDWYCVEIRRAA